MPKSQSIETENRNDHYGRGEELEDNALSRLRRLDSCAVSDAMDKLAIAGACTGLRQLSTQKRIVGRAITIRLGIGQPPPGPARHLGAHAIEIADPGVIIVIEQRTGIDAGCWGGILSLAAKLAGVEGVVADGPVRDIDQARELSFPIFGRNGTCRTARNRIVEKATNEPIKIEDVQVRAGDYVLADASGICFLPQEQAMKIILSAEEIHFREAEMCRALLDGTNVSTVMGAKYERMVDPK